MFLGNGRTLRSEHSTLNKSTLNTQVFSAAYTIYLIPLYPIPYTLYLQPPMWLFLTTYFLWILSEISLSLFRRSKKSDNKNTDKGSLGLIWVIIIIANALAYTVSGWIYLSISTDPDIRYVGLGLIIVGMILRLTIVASLGKFFTVNVTILEDHKLKQDGFYKYVRHPSYSASLLSFIGYGVVSEQLDIIGDSCRCSFNSIHDSYKNRRKDFDRSFWV